MARQGSVSFGASRRPLYDAVVGALFVLICAASVYLPILLLPGAIVLCALLRGGRTTYPALLFALGFAAIVLVCGSFLFAILALVFLLFAVLPIALFQKKLANRAHFDGVLVQCAGVALGIAAVYGVLYLLLGAEPIHTICAAFESALMQDESESATELLRLSWELKQSMYLMNGETSPTAGALMQVLNSAAALSREELAAQTAGFAESLARSVLPTVCVLLSSVGALICYVLPSLWLSRPDRGIGKFLSLDPCGARPLPPFANWQLPRDIGAGLFGAVILFLIASFAGWEAADRIMLLLYTLFTAVFYVQGVSCCVLSSRAHEAAPRRRDRTDDRGRRRRRNGRLHDRRARLRHSPSRLYRVQRGAQAEHAQPNADRSERLAEVRRARCRRVG